MKIAAAMHGARMLSESGGEAGRGDGVAQFGAVFTVGIGEEAWRRAEFGGETPRRAVDVGESKQKKSIQDAARGRSLPA